MRKILFPLKPTANVLLLNFGEEWAMILEKFDAPCR